jgi:hypothetical protein
MTTDNNVISVDLSTLARVDELAAKTKSWAEYSEYIALTSSHPAHAAHTLHAHAPLLGPGALVRDTLEWLCRHSGSEYLHLMVDGVIGQLPLLQRHDAVMSILNKIDDADTLDGGRGRNTATVEAGVWHYRVGNTEVKILALEGRAQVGIRSYGPDGCKGSVEVRTDLDAEGYMTPAEIDWWEEAGANNGRLKDFASLAGIWAPEGVRNSTP